MKLETIQLTCGACLHRYTQEMGHQDGRAILILPGGGYTSHELREKEPIALAYLSNGYQVFVLDYLLTKPLSWAATWNSTQEAMKLLYESQTSWQFTFSKLALIGFSAGGHLAMMMASRGSLRPCGVLLCYPLISEKLAKLVSPELSGADQFIDEQTPPVFIFSTFEDHTVPVRNTLKLLSALNDHHVPFESHIFQWGHHGLTLAQPWTANGQENNIDAHAAHWFSLSMEWLDRILAGEGCKTIEKEDSIDVLRRQPETAKLLYEEFPLLKGQELLEALGHFTVEELREKLNRN